MSSAATPFLAERAAAPSARPASTDWLGRFLWAVVMFGYVAHATARLWPVRFASEGFVYSAVTWIIGFVQTGRFHLGLLGIPIMLLALLTRRFKPLIALVPAVLYGLWPGLAPLWRLAPSAEPDAPLTLMSANLLRGNRDADALLKHVQDVAPDVLFLQEYTPRWNGLLAARLAEHFPIRIDAQREDSFGVAVFSKQAFAAEPQIFCLGAGRRPGIRCETTLLGQRVVLYNVHVVPPTGLGWSIEQRRAFADLLNRVRGESHPVVLAGDFNSTDDGPIARALRRLAFRDAHELAGVGRGATWPDRTFFARLPGIRIDHIYLDRRLTATRSEVGPAIGSDHRPIHAKIHLLR